MFRYSTSRFPDDAWLLMDFLFGTKQASIPANRRLRQRKLVAPPDWVFVYIVTFHAGVVELHITDGAIDPRHQRK